VVVLACMLSGAFIVGSIEQPTVEEVSPPGESLGLHVISLNATSRMDTLTSTFYIFPDCPQFASLRERYGATLGLLIRDCSGPNSSMRIWENDQRMIDQFEYHGQSLIGVGSWHSWGYDKDGGLMSESWGWMENASVDWENGLWNSSEGLAVEHHENVSLGQAEIDIIYVVRDEVIPEFETIAFVILVMVAIIILWRPRK